MPKKPSVRIPIDRNPEAVLKLAAAVYAKHQKLGKDSPLSAIEEWVKIGPTIAPAKEHHDAAEAAKKTMEDEYELRDKALPDITDVVARSRNILANINSRNPRALGEWGYTVDDTPRAVKKKTSAKPE